MIKARHRKTEKVRKKEWMTERKVKGTNPEENKNASPLEPVETHPRLHPLMAPTFRFRNCENYPGALPFWQCPCNRITAVFLHSTFAASLRWLLDATEIPAKGNVPDEFESIYDSKQTCSNP